MAKEMPLVSVIVPMYDCEKYIETMLDSVIVQTLENFELIIVDDCSTDNSAAIVKNHLSEFDGRLKIVRMKENSGGPSLPRNKGLEISRGKYVFFMDNDDAITHSALEDLYNIAEKYEADVVICKQYMESIGEGKDFLKNILPMGDLYDTNTNLLPESIAERLPYWLENFFLVYPWLKFIKRDFLIENNIKFLPVVQEDSIWTFEIICLAKKIILAPNICYIHRQREDSLTSTAIKNTLTVKSMRRKMDRLVNGFKHIDNFMGKIPFFRNNLEKRYAVLDHIAMQNLSWIYRVHGNYPVHTIYINLKEAFKSEMGDNDVLISYLTTNTISMIKLLKTMRQMLDEAKGVKSDSQSGDEDVF